MPKSVPHSFFPVFYTLWIHFVYFIIVCVEKCILHRERKEMCKIRVPVRKTWKVRDRRRGRKNVGGWREREGGGDFGHAIPLWLFDLYQYIYYYYYNLGF